MKIHQLEFPITEVSVGDIIQIPENRIEDRHNNGAEALVSVMCIQKELASRGIRFIGASEGKIITTKLFLFPECITIRTWKTHDMISAAASTIEPYDIFINRKNYFDILPGIEPKELIVVTTTIRNKDVIITTLALESLDSAPKTIIKNKHDILEIRTARIREKTANELEKKNPLLREDSTYNDSLSWLLSLREEVDHLHVCKFHSSKYFESECDIHTTFKFKGHALCLTCLRKICAASVYADASAFKTNDDNEGCRIFTL